jgi:bifunctional non-homologous end joining protein LigD
MARNAHKTQVDRILKNAIKAPMPMSIAPMSFKIAPEPFNDEAWQFEIKWDGFRILSYNHVGNSELRSKNNASYNKRFASIKNELERLNLNAVIDGEVVVLDKDGCSDFDSLIGGSSECLAYYVFDILWYNGYNLMDLPLMKRRELLNLILRASDTIRYSDHVDTNGKELFELLKGQRVEGIVAKNKYSHYLAGIRTSQWLKIKIAQVSEAVVAGLLLDEEKEGSGFSSLIIGVKEQKTYKYIGLVEAGLNRKSLYHILSTAKATKQSIFSPVPNVNKQLPFRTKIKKASVIWLQPTIKCQVKYLELDKFGMMRHAIFKGLTI